MFRPHQLFALFAWQSLIMSTIRSLQACGFVRIPRWVSHASAGASLFEWVSALKIFFEALLFLDTIPGQCTQVQPLRVKHNVFTICREFAAHETGQCPLPFFQCGALVTADGHQKHLCITNSLNSISKH